MKKSSWTAADDAELIRLADEAKSKGKPLTGVFERAAAVFGRQPGSVRNHYYALLREKGCRAAAYVPFSRDETMSLIRDMLSLTAKGYSVRGAALELSRGDAALMLRYQNKFRSLLRCEPELIHRIAAENGVRAAFFSRFSSGRPSLSVTETALAEKKAELKLAHERFIRLHSMFMRLFDMYRELAESPAPSADLVRMEKALEELGSSVHGEKQA